MIATVKPQNRPSTAESSPDLTRRIADLDHHDFIDIDLNPSLTPDEGHYLESPTSTSSTAIPTSQYSKRGLISRVVKVKNSPSLNRPPIPSFSLHHDHAHDATATPDRSEIRTESAVSAVNTRQKPR